ncbi:MAG: hypothetical protein ACLGH0_12215, partial [Thermoanaerobaculia bacterium]
SNTGGSVISANRASVGGELAKLLANINSRYLVVYQSSGTERGWRNVEVKAKGVSARKGYFAE